MSRRIFHDNHCLRPSRFFASDGSNETGSASAYLGVQGTVSSSLRYLRRLLHLAVCCGLLVLVQLAVYCVEVHAESPDAASDQNSGLTIEDSAIVAMAQQEQGAQERMYVDSTCADCRFDSSALNLRQPTNEELQRALRSGDYSYEQAPAQSGPTWLEKLLEWLFGGSKSNVSPKSASALLKIILYGAAIVLLVFVVLWLAKGGATAVVQTAPSEVELSFDEEAMHIAVDDIQRLYQRAVQLQEYRIAVRYLFLIELRALVDGGIVVFEAAKTNRQYVRELGASPLRPLFQQLNMVYEQVWYGEYQLDAKEFEELLPQFQYFSQIRKVESRQTEQASK